MNFLYRIERQLVSNGKQLKKCFVRSFIVSRNDRCSKGDDTIDEISNNYFDRYQQVYESPGLFQNPGNFQSRQLSGDYSNIREQFMKSVAKKTQLLNEKERNEALKYYDFYYKLFNPSEQHIDNIIREDAHSDYYDTYYNMNQSAQQECNKSEVLTHTNTSGQLHMVDVSTKPETHRVAVAQAVVDLGEKAFLLVKENRLKKGDLMSTAKIAGIMAAKNTSNLIPLCHPLAINKVDVSLDLAESSKSVVIQCHVQTYGKTGVEMEALTGVTVAALTVYDMCKAVSKSITISNVQLMHKAGGVNGDYYREQV